MRLMLSWEPKAARQEGFGAEDDLGTSKRFVWFGLKVRRR